MNDYLIDMAEIPKSTFDIQMVEGIEHYGDVLNYQLDESWDGENFHAILCRSKTRP